MYAGQIIEVAPAAQFFASPRHPYAQALLRALPDSGRRGQALAAIAGTVPPLTQDFTGCRFAPRCSFAQAACHSQQPALVGAAGDQVRCLLLQPGGPGLGRRRLLRQRWPPHRQRWPHWRQPRRRCCRSAA